MGAGIQAALCLKGLYGLGARVSECINHPKTATAADIEVGGFFRCEVNVFSCESMDAQEIDVTSDRRKIVAGTLCAIFLEFIHNLPPVS
jgi:hypothetical protein